MSDNIQNGGARGPRISDVAQAAGVSTATVSRVLSRPDLVSTETRDKVLAAVSRTDYRINHAARNLRRRQTGSIIVLVPYLSNPFFSLILSSIARVASQEGINVLVVDTQEPRGAEQQLQHYLDDNRADGLIVLDASLPVDAFLGARRPPAVFACEWVEGHDYPCVHIDNRLGAVMAVEHLIALGHTKIGHLMGPSANILTIQRAAGVRDALQAANLSIDERWFLSGDFTLASGVEGARQWLGLTERPTAVFCASDAMAFGFISELHRHGLRVPDDVSVVGFDDIDIAANFIPPLTTIHQPRADIGETAIRMLISLIGSKDAEQPAGQAASQSLPVNLIARGSTATLRPV